MRPDFLSLKFVQIIFWAILGGFANFLLLFGVRQISGYFFGTSNFSITHWKYLNEKRKCRPPRLADVEKLQKKKKNWLKRFKAVHQKTKFGPKYKWLKISYFKLFFWKCSKFHLSSKCQSQQKLPKKITHFTIPFRSKNVTHFTNLNSYWK